MSGFWVLEDLRCEKWSPTPQYLHADAGFYSHNGNWYGEIGGGGHLQTPEIHKARRFPSQEEAESFRMTHGADCGMNTRLWASREHAFVAPAQDLGVAVADTSAERDCPATDVRPCSCPAEEAPALCQQRFALSECLSSAVGRPHEFAANAGDEAVCAACGALRVTVLFDDCRGRNASVALAEHRIKALVRRLGGIAELALHGDSKLEVRRDLIVVLGALEAGRRPLPTTASAVEEGKITEGEKEKPLFCRDDEDPVAFQALVDAAARQSDRELAQEAASREAGLREALETCDAVFAAMEDDNQCPVPGHYGAISGARDTIRQALSSVQREGGEL